MKTTAEMRATIRTANNQGYRCRQVHTRDLLDDIDELMNANNQVQDRVLGAINRFQDMVSWQPGESRNELVVEIREAARKALSQDETA